MLDIEIVKDNNHYVLFVNGSSMSWGTKNQMENARDYLLYSVTRV